MLRGIAEGEGRIGVTRSTQACCLPRWGCASTCSSRFSLCTLFSRRTIYIILLIFSPDRLYSREYSRILRIPRGRSTEAKNRSKVPKVAPKPAQILQNLKSSVGVDPKPTVEGGNSCFELSRQDRFRRRTAATSRIFKNIFGLEVY